MIKKSTSLPSKIIELQEAKFKLIEESLVDDTDYHGCKILPIGARGRLKQIKYYGNRLTLIRGIFLFHNPTMTHGTTGNIYRTCYNPQCHNIKHIQIGKGLGRVELLHALESQRKAKPQSNNHSISSISSSISSGSISSSISISSSLNSSEANSVDWKNLSEEEIEAELNRQQEEISKLSDDISESDFN